MMRLSRSRPIASVPSGYAVPPCSHSGGKSRAPRSAASGACGARRGAAIALSAAAATSPSPTNSVSLRPIGPRYFARTRANGPAAARVAVTARSRAYPDAWVQQAVTQIHEEVDEHDPEGEHDDDALHD